MKTDVDTEALTAKLLGLAVLFDSLPSDVDKESFAAMLSDATRALINEGSCVTIVLHAPEEGSDMTRIGLHAMNANEIEVVEVLETILERMRKEQRWELATAKAQGGVH